MYIIQDHEGQTRRHCIVCNAIRGEIKACRTYEMSIDPGITVETGFIRVILTTWDACPSAERAVKDALV